MDYLKAWQLQRALADRVAAGHPDILLLLEHPPTYTLGARGGDRNMLVSREALMRQGAAVYNVDRGGDITFHGPGQLVGYPILNLKNLGTGIRLYLRSIEEVIISVLGAFGVPATRCEGYTGVWVCDEKIAAIGVKITAKRITQHGFALNVNTDLSYFRRIVPCGIKDRGVTTLSRIVGRDIPLATISEEIAAAFSRVFSKEMIQIAPANILQPAGMPEEETAA